jgi:GGDEF domain-containing protein
MRQGEILARWAGERMAWLMLDANEDVANKAVKRVRSKLEQGVFEDEESGERFFFNGNFGVVVLSNGTTESELMSVAEQALGEAELSGAGSVVIK